MLKPVKHRIGFWTLISLVPAVPIFLISFSIVAATGADGGGAVAVAALTMLYIPLALVVGLGLMLWGNIEFNRAYRAAQRYAELHGWHPISRTAWRNRKRNNVALSVAQSFQRRTFILTIEVEGETVTIDEFETSLWALEFGDWIWEELLQSDVAVDKITIEEKRSEWEQSRAMAIYRPGGPVERSR